MMHVSNEMKQKVQKRIDECVAIIEARTKAKMPAMMVTYDINSSRLGGQACYPNRVRFNPVFLNQYGDEYIADTVTHEVAHIAAWAVYGRGVQAHGSQWKLLMRMLGQRPERCHDYEVPEGMTVGKQKMKYNYRCKCCGKTVTTGPKVHANIQRGQKYWCATCGRGRGLLEFIAAAGRVSYSQARAAAENATPPVVKKVVVKPATPVAPVQPATTDLSKCATKMDKCVVLFKQIKSTTSGNIRAACIDAFISQVGMTKAGASTYYATIAKQHA